MKPIYLEFQAFGPYKNKESVDFEKLSNSGIFLIKGPTGSGKTTIFDAMTYALYGGSSGDESKGKSGRNDFEAWRCNQADKDLPTFVSFEFESNGRRYKFTRSLIPKRVNLDEQLDASEFTEDGVWKPLFENPKKDSLNKKAEELVGLSKEQFRQVVLLPQGQFEKFLTADSSQKEEILSRIFGTDKWAGFADKFFEAAKARKDELDEIRKRIDIVLAEENGDFACLDDLNSYIETLTVELNEAISEHERYDAEGKQKKLSEDIALAEKFAQLNKLKADKESLEDQQAEIDSASAELEQAEKAEVVRPAIKDYEQALKAVSSRAEELKTAETDVPIMKASLDDAEVAKVKHKEESPVDAYQRKIAEYEAKKAAYSNMKAASDKLAKAKTEYESAKNNAETKQNDLESAKTTAANQYIEWENLAANATEARRKYYSGIYGELASELIDNEKCPVCGSTSHPEPAVKAVDSVSKDEMESAENSANDAKEKFDKCEEARRLAEDASSNALKDLADAKAAYEAAQHECDVYRAQLIEGISDGNALEKEIQALRTKISNYEAESAELTRNFEEAKEAYQKQLNAVTHAQAELRKATDAEAEACEALKTQLADCGYESVEQVEALLKSAEERNAIRENITEFNTKRESNRISLEQKTSELSGCVEPDKSTFDSVQDEINREKEDFQKHKTNLEGSIKRLGRKLDEYKPLEKRYDDNITQAANDLAFARKLRGDNGIGLQRYVLGIMFNQVIVEANEMLKNIHGGRYQLIRTDDKGRGKKKGLELVAHDNRSPEKEGRSVGTLSGGEKFLVSLALSIGMSSVAQKSGIRIEALFIDEGFGTLDDESINDAMDVLEYVKRSNSLVGIISHVQLLEANIGTHIEVIKSEEGSTLRK